MDVNGLKGRTAEALVEAVLRQAGYRVARVGRESHVEHLVKAGPDEFMPDFLAWKRVEQSAEGHALHRLLAVEAKYRARISEYLQRDGHSDFSRAAAQWPDGYFILVTDNPELGRSCFQVFELRDYSPDTPLATKDLHEGDLGIYPKTVRQYERLVRAIFPLLASQPLTLDHKPADKAPSRVSLLRDTV